MEGEDEIALQGLLAHRYNQEPRESQELKSTSKFQEVQDSFDREFGSGDPDFDEAERQANLMAAGVEPKTSPKVSPNKNNLDQKRRAQWGNGDSFGARYDLGDQE